MFKLRGWNSFLDQKLFDLSTIRTQFYNMFIKRANKDQLKEVDQTKLHKAGLKKLESELCLINIVQTLQKLKAAVNVIIDRSIQ
jgi:hypothetical protein